MKELFIAAHEELVEQYLLDHPGATWVEAYEKTADGAYDLMREKFADMVDDVRLHAKYNTSEQPAGRVGEE